MALYQVRKLLLSVVFWYTICSAGDQPHHPACSTSAAHGAQHGCVTTAGDVDGLIKVRTRRSEEGEPAHSSGDEADLGLPVDETVVQDVTPEGRTKDGAQDEIEAEGEVGSGDGFEGQGRVGEGLDSQGERDGNEKHPEAEAETKVQSSNNSKGSDVTVQTKEDVVPRVDLESETNVEPDIGAEAKPEIQIKVEPESEVKAESESEFKVQPDNEVKNQPKSVEPEIVSDRVESEVETEVDPNAEGELEPEPEPLFQGEAEEQSDGIPNPGQRPESQFGRKSITSDKAEGTPETESRPESEGNATSAGQYEPEVKKTTIVEEAMDTPEAEDGAEEQDVDEAGVKAEKVEGEGNPKSEGDDSKTLSEAENGPEAEGKLSRSHRAKAEVEGSPEDKAEAEGEGVAEAGAEAMQEAEAEAESESEIGGSPEYEEHVLISLVISFSLVTVLVVAGNYSLIHAILARTTMRTKPANIYLLSLLLSRLCIGLFVVPGRITGMFSEHYLGQAFCKLCHYAAQGSLVTSVLSIVAMAIVRLREVKRAKEFGQWSLRRNCCTVLTIWILGFTYALRSLWVTSLILVTTPSSSIWMCIGDPAYSHYDKYFMLGDLFVLLIVPLTIIIPCYFLVISQLNRERSNCRLTIADRRLNKRNLQSIKMTVCLTLLFVLCSSPPIALSFYLSWGGALCEGIEIVEAAFYMVSYSNAWINVVVFLYFRCDLRAAFFDDISRLVKRKTKVGLSTESVGNLTNKMDDSGGTELSETRGEINQGLVKATDMIKVHDSKVVEHTVLK